MAHKAPESIVALVEHFASNEEFFLSPLYNETQLRREFLEPFFEALGWDVTNKSHYAESYKDVTHEPTRDTEEGIPDYSFRIGGTPKFYLEAKKPSVKIKTVPEPARQIRRYGWSSKLPLGVLGNFRELALYDMRTAPKATDGPAVARISYYTYREYIEKWDEIEARLSKGAVLKGSFDQFVVSSKAKKGTEEVDQAFLKDMKAWRLILASNIALRNPEINQRDLSSVVQRTIDRIVFLRICEDRGLEPYGQLRGLLGAKNVYGGLAVLFLKADARYNSGLFHFKPEKGRAEKEDTTALKLKLDDPKLRSVIEQLYYPARPYAFSHIPLDILGKVYEQFLAQVVRLTPKRQVRIEDRPDLKRKEGVYYTPPFVVEYIVQKSLSPLLDGKAPKDIQSLRVVDPACGSGSFLIGAYQHLLRWYLDRYSESRTAAKDPRLYRTEAGSLRLSLEEKKVILLRHIYGVDIDPAAIEVSKLSLFLALLEGESQLNLFHQRALPDLGDNLQCGNALIDSSFYDNEQMFLLDEEDRYRINAFDWKARFPSAMKRGFDVVIGNPPYGYSIEAPEASFYSSVYKHQDYQKDLYLLFFERYSSVLARGGTLGIITSNTWLQSVRFTKIRKHFTNEYLWRRILHLPDRVFDATVDTHVLIFERVSGKGTETPGELIVDIRHEGRIDLSHTIPLQSLDRTGAPVNIVHSPEHQKVIEHVRSVSIDLAQLMDCFNGLKPFEKGKGVPPQTAEIVEQKPFVREGTKPNEQWSPLLRGSLIRRYQVLWDSDYWIKYGPWLAAARDPAIFRADTKIMVRQTGDSLIAAEVPAGFYARNNMHILLPKSSSTNVGFVLALLNSKVMDFVYSYINPEKGEALAEVKKHHLEHLPVPNLPDSNASVRSLGDKATLMTKLLAKRAKSSSESERVQLWKEIAALGRQIDKAVYSLYKLEESQVTLIEAFAEKHSSSSISLD